LARIISSLRQRDVEPKFRQICQIVFPFCKRCAAGELMHDDVQSRIGARIEFDCKQRSTLKVVCRFQSLICRIIKPICLNAV